MTKNGLPTTGKTTIKHVAQDAGVSVSAVSKVLRNAYGVSDALRAKVLKSIEKLGYRPSTAARAMRGKTYCIGVLLVEMRNPFLPTVLQGAKSIFSEAGFKTLIGVGEAKTSLERSMIDSMIDFRMDGLFLIAPRLSREMLSHYAAQIPIAVVGHHEADAHDFDTVNSDDEKGAYIAVESLIASGRRDIHMVSLPNRDSKHEVHIHREKGYLAAMKNAGLSDYVKIWRIQERNNLPGSQLETVLDVDVLPQAMFCWCDSHAIALLNLAKTRGIDVPNQMAIVGYDNTQTANLPLISLTSVEQNGQELGELAARSIISRIGGRTTPEHYLVPPSLIIRESS